MQGETTDCPGEGVEQGRITVSLPATEGEPGLQGNTVYCPGTGEAQGDT